MKEAIKNLVGLIEEHPDMDVKLMVDNETLAENSRTVDPTEDIIF